MKNCSRGKLEFIKKVVEVTDWIFASGYAKMKVMKQVILALKRRVFIASGIHQIQKL